MSWLIDLVLGKGILLPEEFSRPALSLSETRERYALLKRYLAGYDKNTGFQSFVKSDSAAVPPGLALDVQMSYRRFLSAVITEAALRGVCPSVYIPEGFYAREVIFRDREDKTVCLSLPPGWIITSGLGSVSRIEILFDGVYLRPWFLHSVTGFVPFRDFVRRITDGIWTPEIRSVYSNNRAEIACGAVTGEFFISVGELSADLLTQTVRRLREEVVNSSVPSDIVIKTASLFVPKWAIQDARRIADEAISALSSVFGTILWEKRKEVLIYPDTDDLFYLSLFCVSPWLLPENTSLNALSGIRGVWTNVPSRVPSRATE